MTPQPAQAQVVTANHLLEGDVIYLRADGQWTRHLHEAEPLHEAEHANARLAQAESEPHIAVGAYLVAMDLDAQGRPVPNHFREAFRTRGPSNYFHGKQEQQDVSL